MPTVTCILGFCGSGKSWHADRLLREGKADLAIEENLLSDDYPEVWEEFVKELRDGKDCVVTEIVLGDPRRREVFVRDLQDTVPGVEIKWICIEKDLEKANQNCRDRKNKRDPQGHIRINAGINRVFKCPDGIDPIPMWPYGD